MNDNNNKSYTPGVTFIDLLLVAFIVLKLCGVVTWSWWWVFSPLWISAALVILIVIAMAIYSWASNR